MSSALERIEVMRERERQAKAQREQRDALRELGNAKRQAETALRELSQRYTTMALTYPYGDSRIERERDRARGARDAAVAIHSHQTERIQTRRVT